MDSVSFQLPPLVIFWLTMAVLGFGGWSIFTSLVGLGEDPRWETQLVFWVGRILLVALSITVLVLASWGLMSLSIWAMIN